MNSSLIYGTNAQHQQLLASDSGPLAANQALNYAVSPSGVDFFPDWNVTLGGDHLRSNVGTILGGIPDQHDLAPSLVFALVYAMLLVPIALRLKTGTLTFQQIWRPLLVILLNVTTFSIRIKLSEGHRWNKDTFITEVILLRLTPILLVSSLLSLCKDAFVPYILINPGNLPITILLRHFVSVLQLATYFCLGLTLAIIFDVKLAINGSEAAHEKLFRSRQVSVYMLLCITGCIFFTLFAPYILLKKRQYGSMFLRRGQQEYIRILLLQGLGVLLLVVTTFRTAQLLASGFKSRLADIVDQKFLFYSVCVTAEYFCCTFLVALDWAHIVPPRETVEAQSSFCKVEAQSRLAYNKNEDRVTPKEFSVPQTVVRRNDQDQCFSGANYGDKEDKIEHSVQNKFVKIHIPSTETIEAARKMHSDRFPLKSSNSQCRESSTSLSTINEVRQCDLEQFPSQSDGGASEFSPNGNIEENQKPVFVGCHKGIPSSACSIHSHWSSESEDDDYKKKNGNLLVRFCRM